MADADERRTLADTWKLFEADGVAMPWTETGEPFIPSRMPNFDDDRPLGFSYFRSGLFDADLSNVTLPRTFFGRSSIERVNFLNSDLHESRMCWNDFTNCDFSGADLRGCDLRASNWTNCKFIGADLREADLRCSSYSGCDFAGAHLDDASSDLPSAEEWGLLDSLSDSQIDSMVWHQEPGDEPGGG